MLSVVVPIFNEEVLIDTLHGRLSNSLLSVDDDWQVIYVNDGSRDRSLSLLRELQEDDPRIIVVDLSRNWGHQSAITAGLSMAKGDAVVLIDGDLQDPPEVIPEMVAAWTNGAKVVVAQRRSRAEHLGRRMLFSLFYRMLGFLADYPIPLNAGIFGLLDRQAVEAINGLSESNRYLPGLRAWSGFPTTVVYYDRAERYAGEPKQNLWRLLKYGLDAIFSFSYKPLRLSLVIGIPTALFALLYGLVLITCWFFQVGLFGNPVVAGYTSTIVSILFLGGVQLVSVGILGEYVGRIYDEVKRRPLFLVNAVYKAEREQCNPRNTKNLVGSIKTTGSTAENEPSSDIGSTVLCASTAMTP